MNTPEQALAYAKADFSEPHGHFVELFEQKFPDIDLRGTVLDLGCGPADISRRFARQYQECIIHGIDAATHMLAQGRDANAQARLDRRIQLFEVYLPSSSLPLLQYDAVISNSLLHHLQDPMVLWQSIRRYTCIGGPVFIMDLRRPPSLSEARAMVDHYAENEPAILRDDFYASLCAAYTPQEILSQLQLVDLDRLQIESIGDRHVIIFGYIQ